MTTQVYAVKFLDGKRCMCIAMEPASDAENIESIKRNMCGKVESVEVKHAKYIGEFEQRENRGQGS